MNINGGRNNYTFSFFTLKDMNAVIYRRGVHVQKEIYEQQVGIGVRSTMSSAFTSAPVKEEPCHKAADASIGELKQIIIGIKTKSTGLDATLCLTPDVA